MVSHSRNEQNKLHQLTPESTHEKFNTALQREQMRSAEQMLGVRRHPSSSAMVAKLRAVVANTHGPLLLVKECNCTYVQAGFGLGRERFSLLDT